MNSVTPAVANEELPETRLRDNNVRPLELNLEKIREAALSAAGRGQFEAAGRLWRKLLSIQSKNTNFAKRLLDCVIASENKHAILNLFPDLYIDQSNFSELSQHILMVVKSQRNLAKADSSTILHTLWAEKLKDNYARTHFLRLLSTHEAELVANEVAAAAPPRDVTPIVHMVGLLDNSGHNALAWSMFTKRFSTKTNGFYISLLGARIACQIGASDEFNDLVNDCINKKPPLPERHAITVFALICGARLDLSEQVEAARLVAEAVAQEDIRLSYFWRFQSAFRSERGAAFLGKISGFLPSSEITEDFHHIKELVLNKNNHEQLFEFSLRNRWKDPAVSEEIVLKAIEDAATRSELQDRLNRLKNVSHYQTTELRELAQSWQSRGRYSFASAIWVFLGAKNHNDEWARINAVTSLSLSDLLPEARMLASTWSVTEGCRPIDVHIAHCFSRVGFSERAASLFMALFHNRDSLELTPAHEKFLSRGLLLYGFFREARAILDKTRNSPIFTGSVAIVDPGHLNNSGHHLNYNIFFSSFLADSVQEAVKIVINRDHSDQVIPGAHIVPSMIFEPYFYNSYNLGRMEIIGLNKSFAEDLRTTFSESVPAVLVLHSVRGVMMKGLLDWLQSLGSSSPRKVIIGLIEADFLLDETANRLFSDIVGQSLETISDLNVDHLVVYAETDEVVAWLRTHLPDDIQAWKFPFLAAALAEQAIRLSEETEPVFGILGATRRERGFKCIFQAALLQQGVNSPKWNVHVDRSAILEFDDGSAKLLSEIERKGLENFKIIEGFLSNEEYYLCLKEIDVLVLPYTGRYVVSGSGLLYEAIYSRKFIITAKGTSLARELSSLNYPHSTFDASDYVMLANAVEVARKNWRRIRRDVDQFFEDSVGLPLNGFKKCFDAERVC